MTYFIFYNSKIGQTTFKDCLRFQILSFTPVFRLVTLKRYVYEGNSCSSSYILQCTSTQLSAVVADVRFGIAHKYKFGKSLDPLRSAA